MFYHNLSGIEQGHTPSRTSSLKGNLNRLSCLNNICNLVPYLTLELKSFSTFIVLMDLK